MWDGNASRVEMHLVSRVAQDVEIEQAALRFRLEEGETIWTESSYKFEAAGIGQLVEPTGFAAAAAVDRPASPIRADTVRRGLSYRSDLNAARISCEKSCGCSHAAKCPPLSSVL